MIAKCVWDKTRSLIGQYGRYQSWDSLVEYLRETHDIRTEIIHTTEITRS